MLYSFNFVSREARGQLWMLNRPFVILHLTSQVLSLHSDGTWFLQRASVHRPPRPPRGIVHDIQAPPFLKIINIIPKLVAISLP
jgi:hypothetical protein